METILSIAVGLVLAAACGFRDVLPLAGPGIAAGVLATGAVVTDLPPPSE